MISAILPARRAVRIPAVAALVDHSEGGAQSLRRGRVRAGGAVAIAGVGAVLAGLTGPTIVLVGAGAVAVFIAAGMLAAAHRSADRKRARPPAVPRCSGRPRRLARENAMRNPRRTAQTAAALMIGLALVSTIAVLGASLRVSAAHSVDTAINADYIISGEGGFSRSVVPAVAHLPGVTTATTAYQGQFEFRGSLSTLTAVSPAHLAQTINLHVIAGGGPAALAAGELLIDSRTAQLRRPPRRFGGGGQVRPDRRGDDPDRRDLQAQPARRQLLRRRALLPLALRQPPPGRRPAANRPRHALTSTSV